MTRGPSTRGPGAEEAVAALLFAGACAAFLLLAPGLAADGAGAAALGLFALLVGTYFGASAGSLRRGVAGRLRPGLAGAALGPAVLLVATGVYAGVVGLPVLPRVAGFGAYLLLPTLLVSRWRGERGAPWEALAAAVLLWIPIELDLLPALPLPAPGGADVSRFVGLAAALYLFLVARELPRVGYTYLLRARDLAAAGVAFAAFSVVALPVGLATGFLAWQPELGVERLPLLLVIFFAIAVPEEFLFRGLMQNLLSGPLGERRALAVASVVFGLAHLPDPRYVLLASVAGVAYGWVYLRTGRITAAAVTHAAVDWVWALLLGGG